MSEKPSESKIEVEATVEIESTSEPVKSELEISSENLSNFEKEVSSLNDAMSAMEKKNPKSPEDDAIINGLREEVEKRELNRKALEDSFRMARLESEVAELKKLIKEGRTGELGLDEKEAKEVIEELESAEKGESDEEKTAEINALKKEIEDLDRALGSGEVFNKYGHLKEGGDGYDKFDYENTNEWAVREMHKREDRIKDLEAFSVDSESEVTNSETEVETENPSSSGESKVEADSPSTSDESKGEDSVEGKNTESNSEKRPIPLSASNAFAETYEKIKASEKGKSKWGFIKERLKGLATVGFWEFHQAERFRSKTKESAKEITGDAKKIQQTEVLDLDAALEEASEMKRMSELQGKEKSIDVSKDDYEKYSNIITKEKKESNSVLISSIINQSTKNLEENLAKYKDAYGDSAVTADKLDGFRTRLRGELETLQRGFIFKEELDGKGELGKSKPSKVREAILANPDAFKKTIRESLDPKWWKRYVYGGAEMALWATAGAISTYNYLGGAKAAVGKSAEVVGVKISKDIAVEGGSSIIENMNMKDTIWNTSKEWLQQNGIINPSNADIMNVSKQVAGDNGIGVGEWGVKGSPMDTNMQQGHILKFAGASKILNAVRIARGLSAIL